MTGIANRTISQLRALKMNSMAAAYEHQLQQPKLHEIGFDERFALLVDQEVNQGSRSYPPDISHPEITFTISRLPIPCPQPSVLCSFLPFWADDGNGQAGGTSENGK